MVPTLRSRGIVTLEPTGALCVAVARLTMDSPGAELRFLSPYKSPTCAMTFADKVP